ncbi:hypothetical protein [Bradyrhizobium sp.]|uniref:hypothetical protein n=1 Tax=Bradyrhizobium sp. TaxID=376 RepID=UPI001D3E30A0|nr:hypothetical protein [Bradyrhizobium sp.]MBI5320551.1 hypothetical protein [Bradyrhizobium sp.]
MTTFADRKEKKPGRLPLILLGIFAVACLAALVFLGDLARYQESAMVGESRAALRDVDDPGQLEQALKRYPSNRILKLVALAREDSEALDAAMRKLLDEAAPAALARPVNLTAASRSDLDALRRDLKTAEGNVSALTSRIAALIKARRGELESGARALGVESDTVKRFMAAADAQHADIAALASRTLAARTEYYSAYEKCAALLVREFGSYKVTNGQFIFRLQPTADSYNAASVAMAAATKRTAELEQERGALPASQLDRWMKFVGN